MATTRKLSNPMIIGMLDALTRPKETADGTAYQLNVLWSTAKALEERGHAVMEFRTIEIGGGRTYQATGVYLTIYGIDFLRNALEYVISKNDDDRPAVYRKWLNDQLRNANHAAAFLLGADLHEVKKATIPHNSEAQHETFNPDIGTLSLASAMRSGQPITRDGDTFTLTNRLGVRTKFTAIRTAPPAEAEAEENTPAPAADGTEEAANEAHSIATAEAAVAKLGTATGYAHRVNAGGPAEEATFNHGVTVEIIAAEIRRGARVAWVEGKSLMLHREGCQTRVQPVRDGAESPEPPAPKVYQFTASTYGPTDYVEKTFDVHGPLYHGGGKNLRDGDQLRPGRKTNPWGDEGTRSRFVHFTTRLDVAAEYAERTGGHVYEVEPTGAFSFGSADEYKTGHPLTVLRKLDRAEWAAPAPAAKEERPAPATPKHRTTEEDIVATLLGGPHRDKVMEKARKQGEAMTFGNYVSLNVLGLTWQQGYAVDWHAVRAALLAADTATPDDSAPLDEMGTDALLTVLREHVGELPANSLFKEAWERLDRTLTDGGIECLPAPWDGYADREHEAADSTPALTFGIADNTTGDMVRDGLTGRAAENLCASLNTASGGRYVVHVIEKGTPRRMSIEEYINDRGELARWDNAPTA
ncbi:NAD(+)--rifampin ADP-ribosyltransferase [Streptomyces albidoflavus]|uniref:NAD(+)--rifampin ADP-ribosyltransferase n=1 Tax=Streptomyces albidoflavus TaxID=1886 RepID=UPI0033E08482